MGLGSETCEFVPMRLAKQQHLRPQVLYTYKPKMGDALIFNSNIVHDGTELLTVPS